MNELQPLIDALQDKLPWLAVLSSIMGLARLFAKPLSALVQSFFTKLLLYVQGTPETDDDAWVERLLASRPYRAFAFGVDWVLSVKLPTSASVLRVMVTDNANPPKDSNSRLGLWLLCGVLAVGAVTTFTGCGGGTAPVTREAQIYYTFKDTWTVAHKAYQGFCERVVQGKVSKESETKVDARWNQFRAAFKISFRAANQDWTQPSDAELNRLRDEVLTLIRTAL